MVAVVLLLGDIGSHMLGYQPSCQDVGHGCREPAVHCKELLIFHGSNKGDDLLQEVILYSRVLYPTPVVVHLKPGPSSCMTSPTLSNFPLLSLIEDNHILLAHSLVRLEGLAWSGWRQYGLTILLISSLVCCLVVAVCHPV